MRSTPSGSEMPSPAPPRATPISSRLPPPRSATTPLARGMAEMTPRPDSSASSSPGRSRGLEAKRRDLLQELLAVARISHRGGRHGMKLLEAHLRRDPAESGQRFERAIHRRFVELAILRQAAAKRRHHLLVEQHRRHPRRAAIGDEAHAVRPDVDDPHRAEAFDRHRLSPAASGGAWARPCPPATARAPTATDWS